MGPQFPLTYDKVLELRRFLTMRLSEELCASKARASAALKARTRMPLLDLLNGRDESVHRQRKIAPTGTGLNFAGYQRLTAASR